MKFEKTSIPPLKKCEHGVPLNGPIVCTSCDGKIVEIREEKDGHKI